MCKKKHRIRRTVTISTIEKYCEESVLAVCHTVEAGLRLGCGARKVVLSSYQQQRILHHYGCSLRKGSSTITKLLRNEGIFVNQSCVSDFLKKYKETGCIYRRHGSGRPTK